MWITSLSTGMAMARAASMTRFTSLSVTSRFLTAMIPWLLKPLICPPAIPTKTDLISSPAISSASPIAFLMDETVLSILITTPLRKPRDGVEPIPMISISPSTCSPTMAQILVVPISRPTNILPIAVIISPPFLEGDYIAGAPTFTITLSSMFR